ncbi:MAG: hypothetical protein ABIA63_06960, partial [bacterium]
WDELNIYLAFICFEPDKSKINIVTEPEMRDRITHNEDHVRFYLAKNTDADKFIQVYLSAGGAVTDYLVTRKHDQWQNEIKWDGFGEYKAAVYNNSWQGEAVLPWSALDTEPCSTIVFNIRRKKKDDSHNSVFQLPYLREPQKFALAVFEQEH